MKNYRQIFLILLACSLVPLGSVSAESSSVNVTTTTNSSNSTNNTVTNNTHIRIETNGVVKECDTKNGDCSYMESEDGSSKVSVNSNTIKATTTPSENNESITPTPTGTKPTEVVKTNIDNELQVKKESLLQQIEEFFKSIFEKLIIKF